MSTHSQTRPPTPMESLIERTQAAGQAWVSAKATASQLKEGRGSVLADLKIKAKVAHSQEHDTELSDAAAETIALASEEYKAYVKGMIAARLKADSLEVTYKNLERYYEAQRTQHVTQRQQERHQRDL